MQLHFSEIQPQSTMRHIMDSNAIALWLSGVGVLFIALALPAFV